MDGSVTEPSPSTPKRRSVRRKMVQSTLFPPKTHVSDVGADEKDKKDCVDDQPGEQEEHCCANENKKRKNKGKVTPRTKDSKLQNSTPRKKMSPNGKASSRKILIDLADTDTPVPDLRLEAKMSAEENSKMFAGRQIHPFFSSWKVGKKFQDPVQSELSSCAVKRKDEEVITCAPIHVFENIEDDPSSLDWQNWTFLGHTVKSNCSPESSTLSVFEDIVEPSNVDKLHSTLLFPSDASITRTLFSCSNQPSIQPQNLQEILPANSAAMASGNTCLHIPETKEDMDVDAEQAGIFGKSDHEPMSRFLHESMRSYYHSSGEKAESSLWAYKYKPTKAFEVCGNDESVKFLRDWLHLWHERRYRSRKDFPERDRSNLPCSDDDDYDYSHSDYDSEDTTEEDTLENVLLITGPIGSGKSAAVYACAQEEGFEVLEVNASDCRNGAAVKQRFGDTLGSRGFKRRLEDTESSQTKKRRKVSSDPALPCNKETDKLNEGVVELISISDDEGHSPVATVLGRKSVTRCDEARTLILVEDVDILFPEDRGCIAAIQQIAETAKGPIILTSNSNNHGLPDNFNKLHVSFSLPSPKELLYHLYMVCVTERVNIHPLVLEKFIQCCDGDIRKAIMHLQFWFQSKRVSKDREVLTSNCSLPFDLEVGHQILPKMIPWGFPSQLAEQIEKEVTKVVSLTEENSCLQGLVEEQLNINDKQNDLDLKQMETDYIKAKKVKMLQRNGSVIDYSELEAQFHALCEFSNSPGTPVAPSKKKAQRKLVVMSSDSEDEDLSSRHPLDICDDADKGPSLEDNTDSPSKSQLNQNYTSPSNLKLGHGLEDSEADQCQYLGTTDDVHLNKTSVSIDVSCVPESTFVPETVIDGTETISGAVSCGHVSDPVEVSVNSELLPFTFSVCKRIAKLPLNDQLLASTETTESSQKEVEQDLTDVNMETTPVYNVMDECSRVDFKIKSQVLEPPPAMDTNIVHKLWRELSECRTDLRQQAASEQPGAFQVVKLTCGMSNLISEADLFGNYQQKQCDIMEPLASLFSEATFNLYDEQVVSTVAEHGYCLYAKHFSDIGLKLDRERSFDLNSEMLASTTNLKALGDLSKPGLTKCTKLRAGKDLEVNKPINDSPKSKMQASPFNVIQSIVPPRLTLALKGVAFNEYLSALRHISRSEAFRISQGVEPTKRRRARRAPHYLSTGSMSLSPEDISSLCEGEFNTRVSSLYTCANDKVVSNPA